MNLKIKRKFIKLKVKLKEASSTEWSLLVIVVSLVIFQTFFKIQNKKIPVGDFYPSPYQLYKDKKIPIGDFE